MKTNSKINVGILGGAGYTGGELIRLLLNHPSVTIQFVHSRSNAGLLLSEVHTDLIGDTYLRFTDTIQTTIDVLFLCLGHGESIKVISELNLNKTIKIIDLSQDFRFYSDTNSSFVYGLPELNKDAIKKAQHIANPGCFATAIQLALLPLASHQMIQSDVHISCTTGSTGAGQSFSTSSHFTWRQNNLSVYKAFTHQHLAEINQSLLQLQQPLDAVIVMIPQRGSFTRGIHASLVMKNETSIETLQEVFANYYKEHPFVHISTKSIDLKQVVNTNKCLLYLEKHEDELLIVSIIDNLLKGASGQAVQNMNLLFGLSETEGLQLKASAF